MITRQEITGAGVFTKTHGINGELVAALSIPFEFFDDNAMFICEMDGIYVPFFIDSVRPRGSKSALIKPMDINNEAKAKLFVNKELYILKRDLLGFQEEHDDSESEGAYADDLIGYTVTDENAGFLGEITDIEDSTANMLFILRTPEDKTLYIPVAEPFIINIDPETKSVVTSLPEGLVDLNY